MANVMTPDQFPNVRAKKRIGVLVPFTNTNLEPDLQMMLPSDVSLHFTRIGGYSETIVPGAKEMAHMGESGIEDALELIAGIKPDAVLYGCTSATLSQGRDFDITLAQKIRDRTGARTITAAGAIVLALHALGARTIGLATPYVGEINALTEQFLSKEGIRTANCAEIGQALLSHEQGSVTPDQIYGLALKADSDDAEAIVLACTDLRAVESIERIEAKLGKPVVTSNQAMVFAVSKALKTEATTNPRCRLFLT